MRFLVLSLLVVRVAAADDPLPGTVLNQTPIPKRDDFNPVRTPLRPADYPYWQDPVNRDRVFDFYTKEALAYLDAKLPPGILPAFPGLDGGGALQPSLKRLKP